MTDEKFWNILLIFWILSSFIANCERKNYFIRLVTTPKCHSIINSELNAVEWIFSLTFRTKIWIFIRQILSFYIRRNIKRKNGNLNGKKAERNKRLFWMFLHFHRFIHLYLFELYGVDISICRFNSITPPFFWLFFLF